MPNNWKTYKLSNALEIKYGKDHKKVPDGDIPIYGTGGIMRYGNQYLYDDESILIPRKGSLNNIYYLNKPFWTVDTLFWSKINKDVAFPKYLYYNLKILDFANMDVGTAIPSLTTKLLNKIEVQLPPLPEQKAIANILSAIDEKIENNLAINKTLEHMAMALYKHWFVGFGPFQDGEFVDSELGPIPKGWEVKRLSELALFKNGKGIKRADRNEDGIYKIYGSNGLIGYTNKVMFNKPVVAIGRVGANYGEIHYSVEPCWISDNAITVQPKKNDCFWWLLQTLRRIDYSNFAGGSAQPLITQGAVKEYLVSVPNERALVSFSNTLDKLFKNLNNNLKENKTLLKSRDTLLPKLISGHVRLNEFKEQVEQIV